MLKRSQVVVEDDFRAVVRGGAGRAAMVLTMALASLSWPGLASALGLGEITLHSALNQPFNARIALIETDGLSSDDLIVKLASPEAFAKAGIERGFFLNDLRFSPVVRGNRSFIEVVSSKPVTEPYLSFMVQVAQPNGDLLREYTLLLDPATSPQGLAATRSRQEDAKAQAAASSASRLPVAPPPAVQGKHYTVASGDTLSAIARRLQGPGSKVSAGQLAEGIQALNPLAFPKGAGSGLKAGQSLLVPDSAVLPAAASNVAPASTPGSNATAAAPAPAEVERAAVELSTAAIENQQLARSVDELKAQNQSLQEQLIERDKAVSALQTRLAETETRAPAPGPIAVPAAPVVATAPVAAPVATPVAAPVVQTVDDNPLFSLPLLLGALLAILLLLGLVYLRRQRRAPVPAPVAPAVAPEEALIKPAQSTVLPVYEIPAVSPQPAPSQPTAPSLSKTPAATRRLAGSAPDALDGVSIYIAYGRFNEAMGILRDALEKEPEREDIRVRILELLAEQDDAAGFEREAQTALDNGMRDEQIQAIRNRYPKLKPVPAAPAPAPVAAGAAAGAAAGVAAVALAAAASASKHNEPPAQLDETAAAALNPEHPDEFQLNLDELSMDADWDLVDPFDNPAARQAPEAAAEVETDPGFASNLNELPEVFELQDDQFLGDLSEPETPLAESIELIEPVAIDEPGDSFVVSGLDDFDELQASGVETLEIIAPAASDELDDAFLDSFAGDEGMEFDLLDLDETPLTLINQAQLLIDEGEIDQARRLLLQVLDESDEAHRQMASDLLASLE